MLTYAAHRQGVVWTGPPDGKQKLTTTNPKERWFHCETYACISVILALMYWSLYSNFTWDQHDMGSKANFGPSEGSERWGMTIFVLSLFGVYCIYKIRKCYL